MAPSIYEYRNPRDWEKAMADWCQENEPHYFVRYRTAQGWQIEAAETYEAAVARVQELTRPGSPRPFVAYQIGRRWVAQMPFHHYQADAAPHREASANHLDGGSRDDYRLAGYHRF